MARLRSQGRVIERVVAYLHKTGLQRHERSPLRVLRVLSWGLWMSLMFTTHPLGRKNPIATLVRLWMWQIWRRLVRYPVVADVDGCNILCPPWSNLASAWISVGLHEYSELTFAQRFVRPSDVVVDVGANLGIYSVLLARHGAKVWSFEPDPRARRILATNLRLNNLSANVNVEEVALSDHAGQAYFTADQECSNHLVAAPGANHSLVVVQVSKLDDYLQRFASVAGWAGITFVKVDAEGFDANVLKGAETLLHLAKPVLCVETWGGGHQLRDWLKAKGYSVYLYEPERARLWPVPEEYRKQANFIAVHNERLGWVAERIGSSAVSQKALVTA